MTKKIAIIGTVGLPANYGGFETLTSYLTKHLASQYSITVYCSSKSYPTKLKTHNGAKLKYLPFNANGVQSILYDMASIFNALFYADVLLILGVSGCIVLPFVKLVSTKKIIVNIDGLEHKRNKWGRFAKWFLHFSEKMAVRFADVIVTDNKGIQDYVFQKYQKTSKMIAYGGDHANRTVDEEKQSVILKKYNLTTEYYALKISRIEPENNCTMILEAFAETGHDFVFIGNWHSSDYSRKLMQQYSSVKNIYFIDSLYDLDELYTLRKHCKFYIHGHSAGGTNPSLVEAMFSGRPILAFDVIYNKETTEYKADYFSDKAALISLINDDQSIFANNTNHMISIAERRYQWKEIARLYEELF